MSDDILSQINILNDDPGALPQLTPPLRRGQYKMWGAPKNAEVCIICTQKVIKLIEAHAKSDPREIGGVLLGKAYRDEAHIYIEITEYIRASSGVGEQSSRVHFSFTPEIWNELLREQDQTYPQLEMVGWFHSHPDHGIFLSPGMDTQIQGEFFQQPWQTALVYDPVRHESGFFIWHQQQIIPAPGFYELFDEGRSTSIVTWKNWETEQLQAAGQNEPPTTATRKPQGTQLPQTVRQNEPPTTATRKPQGTQPPRAANPKAPTGSKFYTPGLITALLLSVLSLLLIAGLCAFFNNQLNKLQSSALDNQQQTENTADILASGLSALTEAINSRSTDIAKLEARLATLEAPQPIVVQAATATVTDTPLATATPTLTSSPTDVPTPTATSTPSISEEDVESEDPPEEEEAVEPSSSEEDANDSPEELSTGTPADEGAEAEPTGAEEEGNTDNQDSTVESDQATSSPPIKLASSLYLEGRQPNNAGIFEIPFGESFKVCIPVNSEVQETTEVVVWVEFEQQEKTFKTPDRQPLNGSTETCLNYQADQLPPGQWVGYAYYSVADSDVEQKIPSPEGETSTTQYAVTVQINR